MGNSWTMSDAIKPAHARSITIDCLRGFSILWVLFYHLGGSPVFGRGNYGVLLFFIISGYCISFSADTSKGAWHFYSKRLGRLLPALVICAFLTTAFKAIAPNLIEASRLSTWSDFAYALIALPTLSFMRLDHPFPDGAYWSLQTEFFFYFIFAGLMATGLRQGMLLRGLCVVAVYHTSTTSIGTVMFDYLPFFIAGIGVAAAREGRLKDAAIGIGVAFALDLYQLRFHMYQPSIPVSGARTLMLWAGTAAVWFAASWELKPGWARSLLLPISWIGLISYPLYLIHQDVGIMLINLGLPRLVVIAAVMLVAWLVYYFVERRTIKPLTNALANPSSLLRKEATVPVTSVR